MKRKQIKIDWDELESAFANQDDSVVFYLDLVTGHVLLEGEGEEDDFDFDDDEAHLEARAVTPSHNEGTRLGIQSPRTEQKIGWMNSFLAADTGLPPAVVEELRQAIDADDPAAALSEVLNRNPDERDAWYVYRADRTREMIDRWLADNGVELSEPSPWSV